MIRNADKFIEILNSSSPSSLATAGLSGEVMSRHDKQTHGDILLLGQNGKLRVPRSMRHELDVFLPNVVLQMYMPSARLFTLEFTLVDSACMSRKLCFAHAREIQLSPLQVRIPHNRFVRDKWGNFCVDLQSYVKACWNTNFHYLKSLAIIGTAKIRRIFAIKNPLQDSSCKLNEQLGPDLLPLHYEIPFNLPQTTQLIKYVAEPSHRKTLSQKYSYSTLSPVKAKTQLKSLNPRKSKHRSLFYQEIKASPEPMLKAPRPGFFDQHFTSLTKIRHKTPPLVNSTKEGIVYDPINKSYVKIRKYV